MMHAFKFMSKLKSLRGTPFDVFGYTQERKTERALIQQYRQTVAALLPQLTLENLPKAVAIAAIPEDIRGFGHVKERHLKTAKEKEAMLLADFNSQISGSAAALGGRHAA
jgi:indolepyruvate ferredoxin oxidoreductase